jgi:hypothetical protein
MALRDFAKFELKTEKEGHKSTFVLISSRRQNR